MTKKELLKVLDMNDYEQWNWIINNPVVHTKGWDVSSVADLAFRLRDEAMSSRYLYPALLDVHQKVEGSQNRKQDFGFWFLRAKPIHWIVAALIAKGSK